MGKGNNLSSMYGANPILYDFNNKLYRNQLAETEARDEIGEKVGEYI